MGAQGSLGSALGLLLRVDRVARKLGPDAKGGTPKLGHVDGTRRTESKDKVQQRVGRAVPGPGPQNSAPPHSCTGAHPSPSLARPISAKFSATPELPADDSDPLKAHLALGRAHGRGFRRCSASLARLLAPLADLMDGLEISNLGPRMGPGTALGLVSRASKTKHRQRCPNFGPCHVQSPVIDPTASPATLRRPLTASPATPATSPPPP